MSEDDSGETELVVCNYCGEVKECRYIKDPFLTDIHPEDENEPDWWCEECASARCDER